MRNPRAGFPMLCVPLLAFLSSMVGCSEQTDISFVVIVKSSNYAQDTEGRLELLNYHFFSEIFLRPGGSLASATLSLASGMGDQMEYEGREGNFYFEGGHFGTQEEVDLAYPNGSYRVDIEAPSVALRDLSLGLEGPGGETDIPEPIRVSLRQDGVQVDPLSVDPEKDLVFRWSSYSNGQEDPRGIVDDMIFLVVANCQGERIFHTGLPFQGEYTTFRTTEMLVGSEELRPGQPYSAFVEFPHVVDSKLERGVPGFASYATATYLDFRTTGPRADHACPEIPPPMDTGQTDRMDSTEVRGVGVTGKGGTS